ncbi:MAG: hypothetical protein RLZZ196_685 [Bacteroidota bacterium]|jgi:heme oxygenase
MLALKEAIKEKHSQAEKMTFNQRMFNGELTKDEYILYLAQQLAIFDAIERFPLPHPTLKRSERVHVDIRELMEATSKDRIEIDPIASTKEYVSYLKGLSQQELLPHVYLNYLAIMFGGQMMKKNVPGSGSMYEFDEVAEGISSVRAIQKDEWADEVNKGLDFNISIFDELETLSKS